MSDSESEGYQPSLSDRAPSTIPALNNDGDLEINTRGEAVPGPASSFGSLSDSDDASADGSNTDFNTIATTPHSENFPPYKAYRECKRLITSPNLEEESDTDNATQGPLDSPTGPRASIYLQQGFRRWLHAASFEHAGLNPVAIHKAYRRNRHLGENISYSEMRAAILQTADDIEVAQLRREDKIRRKVGSGMTDEGFTLLVERAESRPPWRAIQGDCRAQQYAIRVQPIDPSADEEAELERLLQDPAGTQTIFGVGNWAGAIQDEHQSLMIGPNQGRNTVYWLPGNPDTEAEARELLLNIMGYRLDHMRQIAQYWKDTVELTSLEDSKKKEVFRAACAAVESYYRKPLQREIEAQEVLLETIADRDRQVKGARRDVEIAEYLHEQETDKLKQDVATMRTKFEVSERAHEAQKQKYEKELSDVMLENSDLKYKEKYLEENKKLQQNEISRLWLNLRDVEYARRYFATQSQQVPAWMNHLGEIQAFMAYLETGMAPGAPGEASRAGCTVPDHADLVEENQRLKEELAQAQAGQTGLAEPDCTVRDHTDLAAEVDRLKDLAALLDIAPGGASEPTCTIADHVSLAADIARLTAAGPCNISEHADQAAEIAHLKAFGSSPLDQDQLDAQAEQDLFDDISPQLNASDADEEKIPEIYVLKGRLAEEEKKYEDLLAQRMTTADEVQEMTRQRDDFRTSYDKLEVDFKKIRDERDALQNTDVKRADTRIKELMAELDEAEKALRMKKEASEHEEGVLKEMVEQLKKDAQTAENECDARKKALQDCITPLEKQIADLERRIAELLAARENDERERFEARLRQLGADLTSERRCLEAAEISRQAGEAEREVLRNQIRRLQELVVARGARDNLNPTEIPLPTSTQGGYAEPGSSDPDDSGFIRNNLSLYHRRTTRSAWWHFIAHFTEWKHLILLVINFITFISAYLFYTIHGQGTAPTFRTVTRLPNCWHFVLDVLVLSYIYLYLSAMAERHMWHGANHWKRAYLPDQRGYRVPFWGTSLAENWWPDLRRPVISFWLKTVWNEVVGGWFGWNGGKVRVFTGYMHEYGGMGRGGGAVMEEMGTGDGIETVAVGGEEVDIDIGIIPGMGII